MIFGDGIASARIRVRLVTARPAVERAWTAAGGQASLGRALGITSQAISQWKRVPVNRALAVERLTGIPRHELRPDIWPPEAA